MSEDQVKSQKTRTNGPVEQPSGTYIEKNLPLAMVVDWLAGFDVDLGNANIDLRVGPYRPYGENRKLEERTTSFVICVKFDHEREWGENLRALKRAIGSKFEPEGTPPYMSLRHERELFIGYRITKEQGADGVLRQKRENINMKVQIVVMNSFNCTTTCVPRQSDLMEELTR